MEEFYEFEEMMLQTDDFENAYFIDNQPKQTQGVR